MPCSSIKKKLLNECTKCNHILRPFAYETHIGPFTFHTVMCTKCKRKITRLSRESVIKAWNRRNK